MFKISAGGYRLSSPKKRPNQFYGPPGFLLIQRVPGTLSPKATHSSPSIFNNKWSYTSTSTRHHTVQRENFKFYLKNDGTISNSKSRPFIRPSFPIHQTQPLPFDPIQLRHLKKSFNRYRFFTHTSRIARLTAQEILESASQCLLMHPNRQIMTKMRNNWSQLKTCETKRIVLYSYCHAACHGRLLRHSAL